MVTDIYKFCECELNRQFTRHERKLLVSLLKDSYNLRNKVSLENEIFCKTEIGSKDIQAALLRATIAAVAIDYCNRGILPFKCSIEKNTVKNCSHVEFHNSESTLYLARTSTISQKPRSVKYIPYFEPDLFSPSPVPEQVPISTFLLTYGDSCTGNLDFALLGVPNTKGWFYKECLNVNDAGIYTINTNEPEEILVSLIKNGAIENEG